jgi:hypothetical protein
VVRWAAFVGATAGGNKLFGAIPVVHSPFPIFAELHPPTPAAAPAAGAAGAKAAKGEAAADALAKATGALSLEAGGLTLHGVPLSAQPACLLISVPVYPYTLAASSCLA